MAATCMAVCKGSRKKIRGIFISSCHLPVAVECDIVILSEPGPIPQAPVGQFCRHNLSPRGDGNGYGGQGYPGAPRDTTYPREGTETAAAHRAVKPCAGHNLSPRGDGNAAAHRAVKPCAATQLIPARGRKPWHWVGVSWCCIDTTYPREGTETHGFATHRNLDNGTQLIPARGRKRLPAAFEPNFRKTQLIPARGRKPGPERGALLRLLDTTYPREGTETPYRAR